MNNRILIIIFSGLLLIYLLTRLFLGEGNRTFNPEIIKTDTVVVSSIIIRSKADSLQEFLLKRDGDQWTVSRNNKTYPADGEAVSALLSHLTLVKASHVAAKSRDKWAELGLDENQASHITVFSSNRVLADFYVGKFSVNQAARQVISYLRLKKSEEVYAVEGMAGMTLGQGFDAYRKKKVMDIDVKSVEELVYTGDYPFAVHKKEGRWLLDGTTPVDSNRVRDFLLNLDNLSGEHFADDFDPAGKESLLLKTLQIRQTGETTPITIRCWRDTTRSKPFVIESSYLSGTFFSSDSSRLFTRLFKPVSEW